MDATINLSYKSDEIAQPPEGTFHFTPYNLKNKKEFRPIENHLL